ncbi:hypothetical protein TrST_g13700 [Triparma strigata]|uniref:Histone H3-K79 methyltransferase n=1 Tax=Triparma strigata TaxID=1606541 RepID=A0A9W7EWQ3_9STRA|nr:hypothetical protein TrST_g13700 [Triparma strigata]
MSGLVRADDAVRQANLTHFTTAFPTLMGSLNVSGPKLLARSFHSIFSDRDASWEHAHDLSRAARGGEGDDSQANGETSLGYGEILPETVFEVMEKIRVDHGGFSGSSDYNDDPSEEDSTCQSRQVVYDLGSGSGRVIFAACLSHPFTEAHGIEYLQDLHANALQNLELWRKKEEDTHTQCTPPSTEFFFTCGDIAKIEGFKLKPNPTLLICHATLFDNDLFACVQLTAENCDVGTTFVMVTKPLRTGFVTGIQTLSSRQYEMSWGWATIYIQRRV